MRTTKQKEIERNEFDFMTDKGLVKAMFLLRVLS